MLHIFLESRALSVLGYFPRYLFKSSWFLGLLLPLALQMLGFSGHQHLSPHQFCLLFQGMEGGQLESGVWCVVCVRPARGLVRVLPGACDAQLLLTCLRAGTFCEWVGSSDVSETSPRPCVLTFFCFVLDKAFLGRSHSSDRLPRV